MFNKLKPAGEIAALLAVLAAGALLIANVLQLFGNGLSSTIDPLAVALCASFFGGLYLGLYSWTRKLVSFAIFMQVCRDKHKRTTAIRVGASNGVVAVASFMAFREIGLGATVAVMSTGFLAIGTWEVFRCLVGGDRRAKRWAFGQVGIALLAMGGVIVITRPVELLGGLDVGFVVGFACAMVAAMCAWNYTVCIFRRLKRIDTMPVQVASRVIEYPVAWATVFLAGSYRGGGFTLLVDPEFLWDNFLLLFGIAPLFIVAIPAVFQDYVTRSGRVPEKVVGILSSLNSLLAALVGAVGVFFNWFGATQMPDRWVWLGAGCVTLAGVLYVFTHRRPTEKVGGGGRTPVET
jgi:hypothetical protein